MLKSVEVFVEVEESEVSKVEMPSQPVEQLLSATHRSLHVLSEW